jgi:hypothetical protein
MELPTGEIVIQVSEVYWVREEKTPLDYPLQKQIIELLL